MTLAWIDSNIFITVLIGTVIKIRDGSMADYKQMYFKLFHEMTKMIEMIQRAQQEAEEIYINSCASKMFSIAKDEKET